ncbi:hypothetical protein ACVIGB_000547 [Bradyrhizobium sp. USDA 4341]
MRVGSPFDALHGALGAAVHRDLPDQKTWVRDWSAWQKLSKEEQSKLRLAGEQGPGQWRTRRPYDNEVSVVLFPQTWSSTALGYGGIGGQAMTEAYTVIVTDDRVSCVYFGGGRLAYNIDLSAQSAAGRARFAKDVAISMLAACGEEGRYA